MKLLLIRRVVGESMAPTLRPAQIIVASGAVRRLRPGQVVVVRHGGLEKIKRLARVDQAGGQVFVTGDNREQSTDSRHFGWLPRRAVLAVVIWPRLTR